MGFVNIRVWYPWGSIFDAFVLGFGVIRVWFWVLWLDVSSTETLGLGVTLLDSMRVLEV